MSDFTGLRLSKVVKSAPREFDLNKAGFELSLGLTALGMDGMAIVFPGDNGVPPATVKRTAAALGKLTFKRFYAAFRKTDVGAEADEDTEAFLAEYFPVLKAAYTSAAKAGCSLQRVD
jgi:hypothetical protein